MKRIKVHLDTDLGTNIDDLCALTFLLRSPHVEIIAITTVAEQGGKRAGYVRTVLHLDGREEIPVAAGADSTQGTFRYEMLIPPEERYWSTKIKPSPNPLENCLEFFKHSIEQGAILIGIGPLTNFALLEKKYPGILKKATIYLMGGFVFPVREGYPPWKNENDTNFQMDPNSAEYVLKHATTTLVPLSITTETYLRRADLEKLKAAGALGKLIAHQAEAYALDQKKDEKFGKICKNLPTDMINFQHDPLTCAIATGWRKGVDIQTLPLFIEQKDGWLQERIDPSGKPMQIVTKIDGGLFSEFWLDQITKKSTNDPKEKRSNS